MSEEEIIEQRKEFLKSIFKKSGLWIAVFLVIALILGIYIRSLPMTDHGGKPGLWDITTNTWSLGPDLDPWFFLRYANTIIEQGSLPVIDTMRNVPLGFETALETKLLPYMIAWTYKLFNAFGGFGITDDINVTFAGAIFPVIMFGLTILSYFFFVREVFLKKGEEAKAGIIALISTFFMIVIPVFLSRTVAGIPEKESAGFFFMFLAFYLFLKAWKSENQATAYIFGTLAGIATALMGLIWGGYIYIFITIAGATLIAFVLNKVHKKELIIYSLWLISTILIMIMFSDRFSLSGFLTSLSTAPAILTLFVLIVHFSVWKTKLSDIEILKNHKIPKSLLSIIIAIVIGILFMFVFVGPDFFVEKAKAFHQLLFKPIYGRWNITVAENRQPFYTEWSQSFGPFIGNIPILLTLFFIGSIVLFRQMLSHIKKKDSWILTLFYILFLFGLVFSRYNAHPSLLDGDNFISKFIYYGAALTLISGLIYFYNKYHKEGDNGFELIDYEMIFIFVLSSLTLFTTRSAIRLVMVLGPIAPILVSYLAVFSVEKFRQNKEETARLVYGLVAAVIIIASIFTFYQFYKEINVQAYNFIPTSYNQQWQKAMSWVRTNTTEDSVFAHWWDYGYWLQSIGERPTVTDGGNIITWWNYLMGRLVLTGDNQKDSLEFLYNHDADYLLIDSSDIGKYTAFSSIGSNESMDRYSWIPVMVSETKNIYETANGITRIYQGGTYLDEDIMYNQNGTDVFLPAQNAAIIGVSIEMKEFNSSTTFSQPNGIFMDTSKQQISIPLRYIYYNNQFYDFGYGIESCVYIIQRVYSQGQGLQVDNLGSIIYISPRILRGYLGQKYLLNDPFNNFPNFELAYSEPSTIINTLNNQGAKLGEFIYYSNGGIQGPIKIWKIKYLGSEQKNEEYLLRDPPAYITWEL